MGNTFGTIQNFSEGNKLKYSGILWSFMCLAIPGEVIFREGVRGKVDFGGGIIREANLALVDASVGEYVIVHAGFAIQKLDRKQAQETLDVWNELLDQ